MPRKNKSKNKKDAAFRPFKRAYRNDYSDNFAAPGLFNHAGESFGLIFKNWKLFFGLIATTMIFGIAFVGLLNQSTIDTLKSSADSIFQEYYPDRPSEFLKASFILVSTVTTGGISQSLSGDQNLILIFLFVSIWLVTIYLLRQILAKKKTTLKKGLYNAFAPLLSSFVVFLTILLELVPIFLLIIFYSAALKTDFLSTPFYALIFLVFAILLIALSCYLVSSSIIALAAVSVPGTYPKDALRATNDLMFRRRSQFIIRLVFLGLILIFNFSIVLLPIILIDSALKSGLEWTKDIPFISFWLFFVTCFNFVYAAVYIYLYYRKLISYESK